MTDWQEVSLLGGPFDGDVHSVDPGRTMFTLKYLVCWRKQLYGGVIYDVPLYGLASYRRVGESVFQHCRTPTAMGDTDLELPESQLKLTEEEGE